MSRPMTIYPGLSMWGILRNLLHQVRIAYFSTLKHSINDQPYIPNANRYSRRSPVHNLSGDTNRLLLGHSSGTPELVSQSPARWDR